MKVGTKKETTSKHPRIPFFCKGVQCKPCPSAAIEMPREQFDRLSAAIKNMNLPYNSAEDFIKAQAKDIIEKSEKRKNTSNA